MVNWPAEILLEIAKVYLSRHDISTLCWIIFINQVHSGHRPVLAWLFEITFMWTSVCVCVVCVCLCVCV